MKKSIYFFIFLCFNSVFAQEKAETFFEHIVVQGDVVRYIAGIRTNGAKNILWENTAGNTWIHLRCATDGEGRSFFAFGGFDVWSFFILQSDDISQGIKEYRIGKEFDFAHHFEWLGKISVEAPNKIILEYDRYNEYRKQDAPKMPPLTLSFREGKFYDEKGDEVVSYDPSGIQRIREAAKSGTSVGNLTSINLSEGLSRESILVYAKDRKPPEEKKTEVNDTTDAKESEKLPEDIPDETPQNDTAQPSPELPPPSKITPPSTSVPFWYYIAIVLGGAIFLGSGIYWKTKK